MHAQCSGFARPPIFSHFSADFSHLRRVFTDRSVMRSSSGEKITLKGSMISMTSDWVVLKDGNYQNWIPREKVVFIRASL